MCTKIAYLRISWMFRKKMLVINSFNLPVCGNLFLTFATAFWFSVAAAKRRRLKGNPVKVRSYPRSCKLQKKGCAFFCHC
jgi:hypothetical protein